MAEKADEHDLFSEAMGKVKPLAPDDKVVAGTPKSAKSTINISRKRTHAPSIYQPMKPLSIQPTNDPWVFLSDGISRDRIKRLAAGRPASGRTFDLHGMTRDEALGQLEQGFGEVISNGVRAVCIIHGRGLHSQGRPILKDAVYHWLRHGMFAHRVLAVIPQPGSGGGACLALLRRK